LTAKTAKKSAVEEIPESLVEEAMEKREALIDAASLFSDELTEAVLEEAPVPRDAHRRRAQGTLERQITPVFMGPPTKTKAVQPLLDAVTQLLPCPADVDNQALDLDRDEAQVTWPPMPQNRRWRWPSNWRTANTVSLTYIRVYQGRLAKGDTVVNVRTGKKVKIGRLVRMHANQMEDIEISAGYIGALFGVDCASGDTFTDPGST
jgi:elongation factor G